MVTKTNQISPGQLGRLLEAEAPAGRPSDSPQEEAIKNALSNAGIGFPEGLAVGYFPEENRLVLRTSEVEQERAKLLFEPQNF